MRKTRTCGSTKWIEILVGLGVWIEKQWGREGSMRHPRNLLWGRERGPEFQELTCGFLHIDRWHRPKAEELVARGKALGVFS